MEEEEHEIRRLVEAYLEDSKPVQWVNWISRCRDTDSRRALEAIIFENGHLRDLTSEAAKKEVLTAISDNPLVMELVIADFAEEVRNQTGEENK